MSRPSALGSITGDVYKIALLATFRANIRWFSWRNEKSTFSTFPVIHSTLKANIPLKPAVGSVAAMLAYPFSGSFHCRLQIRRIMFFVGKLVCMLFVIVTVVEKN